MLMTLFLQILDKHTIVDMFCPTWISHHISGFVFDAILLWEILAEETNDSIYFYLQIGHFPFEVCQW